MLFGHEKNMSGEKGSVVKDTNRDSIFKNPVGLKLFLCNFTKLTFFRKYERIFWFISFQIVLYIKTKNT
jgi:hypothetical protein